MSSAYITFNGKPVVDPQMLYAECERLGLDTSWYGRPNSFTLTRGGAPATGWILLRKSDFPVDLNSNNHTLTFVVTNRPGRGKVTFRNLCVTQATAVAGGVSPNDSVFLLQLQDRRAVARLSAVNKAYNVHEPDGSGMFYATQNAGSDWTWNTLLSDLWSALPTSVGAYPGISGLTFPNYTPHYQFWGWNAWDAINRVLEDTGHAITRELDEVNSTEWQTGDLKIVSKNATDTTLSTALTVAVATGLEEHGHPQSVTACSIPATFRIFRPKRDYSFQSDHASEVTWGDKHKTDCVFLGDIATSTLDANITTVAGTVLPIWDSYPALYDEAGLIENQSEIDYREETLASLIFQSLTLGDADYTFTGLWRLYPGSVLDYASFYDTGDGIHTTVSADALRQLARIFAGGNGDAYSRPTIVEPSIPYDRWFVGEVTTGAIAPGASGTAKVEYGTISLGTLSWSQKASDTETVYNIANSRTFNVGDRIICKYHWQIQKFLALDESGDSTPVFWGVAYTNWVRPGGGACDYVPVQIAEDCLGTNPSGDPINVLLPAANDSDPNVVTGYVIAFSPASDSTYVCVSDYMDDKIGTVKMWALYSNNIPEGWAIMNGTDNDSAIDMRSRFVRGSTVAGERGGERWHTHTLDITLDARGAIPDAEIAFQHQHSVVVPAHSVSDLEHEHATPLDTISIGWEVPVSTPDYTRHTGCTDVPLVHDGDCLGAAWGPLEHGTAYTSAELINLPTSSIDVDVEVDVVGASATYEEHLPEYKTLIFIERIDNSA